MYWGEVEQPFGKKALHASNKVKRKIKKPKALVAIESYQYSSEQNYWKKECELGNYVSAQGRIGGDQSLRFNFMASIQEWKFIIRFCRISGASGIDRSYNPYSGFRYCNRCRLQRRRIRYFFVTFEGCSDFYPDVLRKWVSFHLDSFQFHYNKNLLLFKAS